MNMIRMREEPVILFTREQLIMIVNTIAKNNAKFRNHISYYVHNLDDGTVYDELDAVLDIEDHALDDPAKNAELLRCSRFALIAISYYVPIIKMNGAEPAFFLGDVPYKINPEIQKFINDGIL